MTQDEVIVMAKQAWADAGDAWVAKEWFDDRVKAFEAFAKLVEEKAAAKEREECAEICDRFQARDVGMQPAECAGAIRARKTP
jgi:hypothetical protein